MTHILLDNSETDSTVIETSGRTIRPALEPVAEVVDEARMHVSDWGLYTRAVDPANVGMVSHAIYPNAFDQYECHEPFTMGLNVNYTTSALTQARLGKRTDDPVTLDMTDSRVGVQIERDGLTYSEQWQNIDPDSIRQEPDLNVSEGDAVCEVDPSQLVDAMDYIDQHSDHAKLTTRDGSLLVEGDQDVGESVVLFDDTDVAESKVSYYSMSYMLGFAKAIKQAKADTVTVSWGDKYPVFMTYRRTDSDENPMYEGQMMLAPRIQS
jgi:proliferating cell nuclear antigen